MAALPGWPLIGVVLDLIQPKCFGLFIRRPIENLIQPSVADAEDGGLRMMFDHPQEMLLPRLPGFFGLGLRQEVIAE